MFPRNKNRVGAAVVLAMALTLMMTAPAGAAGWPVWGDAPIWAGQFLPRVLGWLGFIKSHSACEQGSSIDPNGCPKALTHGSQIDPNGGSSTTAGASVPADHGSSIDPNG
jgi:hypothetical protein